jgi:hypothetical protein
MDRQVQEIRDEIRTIYERFNKLVSNIYAVDKTFLTTLISTIAQSPDNRVEKIALSAYQIFPHLFPTSGVISRLARGVVTGKVPLHPGFGKLSRARQARLVLGTKPSELLPGLLPKEAHEACVLGHVTPADYVLRFVTPLFGRPVTRTLLVARWVAACMEDEPRRLALLHQHDDGHIGGRLFDRTDEIVDEDLARGISTGVQTAFASARARAIARGEQERFDSRGSDDFGSKLLHLPPEWYKPIRCATLLNTRSLLQAEGDRMHHCVGSYSYRVESGDSVIIAIRVPTKGQFRKEDYATSSLPMDKNAFHSTVEYSASGSLVQHKGPRNRTPHELCEAARLVCENRWFGRDAPSRGRARHAAVRPRLGAQKCATRQSFDAT